MRFASSHARDERARDLGAGLVAVRVDDAILRVRRLASELEPARRIEIEVRAGGLQLAHARRSFFDQHLHRRRVAERRAGGERVLPVQRGRVAGAERRGDSALRVRGRAVEQRSLRQQQRRRRAPTRATRCAVRRRRCRRREIECEFDRSWAESYQPSARSCRRRACLARRCDERFFRACESCSFSWPSLVAVHVALLFVRVSGAARQRRRDAVNVGIVLDVGGLGDKSFNDGAYRGAERAEQELGAHDPAHRARRGHRPRGRPAPARRRAHGPRDRRRVHLHRRHHAARQGIPEHQLRRRRLLARRRTRPATSIPPPPNVAALKFKEEEGSFLVGAIAALVGNSKKVGFVGGMDVPLIQKFEAGYKAGVKAVCPDCTVIAQYAGVTPDAFRNPGKGKELALNQYQQGVNVIYHASGSTGLGVFEAARQTGKYAIGVDADQYSEAPGRILTSMVKGIDVAVFDMIKRARDHTFKGGIYTFGLRAERRRLRVRRAQSRADSRQRARARRAAQGATSSPDRSSCRARDEHGGRDRPPHRPRFDSPTSTNRSAPCRPIAARRSRSRAARFTRSSARTAPASRRSCAC